MTNSDFIAELCEMENKIKFHMKIIEDAYDVMEAKVSNWSTKRREILKSEIRKVLRALSEQDRVS